jgi:hypothetical protein
LILSSTMNGIDAAEGREGPAHTHGVGATQRRVGATLERVNALVKTLEAQLYVVGVTGIETQKGREDLYDTTLALLKQAVRFSESKEAAQNA